MLDRLDRLARHAPLVLLLASVAALAGAYGSQHIGGLKPCILCLYQRWPFMAVIVLALLALAVPLPRLRGALVAASGLALLAGAGLAFFHVGVEQHWWAGTAGCGAPGIKATDVEALRRQLLEAPVVRCDEVPWSLFGISLAGYNFLMSTALGAAALLAGVRLLRHSEPEVRHP